MNVLITAGPTYETLDQVRRLTNNSTGRLGCELARRFSQQGHSVHLLLGDQATWPPDVPNCTLTRFGTTSDLSAKLRSQSDTPPHVVLHAAAVSDFKFGTVWRRDEKGELTPVASLKLSTRSGALLAELLPTEKIIARLRVWFPKAVIVGWKFEVDGSQEEAIQKGLEQISDCRTNLSVVNGPAYGEGFAVVRPDTHWMHCADYQALFETLVNSTLPSFDS